MDIKLSGSAEFSSVPCNDARELLISADLVAPHLQKNSKAGRASVDFVAVVDKSGSMSGEPFNLVKKSLQFIVDHLESKDQFSIVSFGSTSSVDLQLTMMTSHGKDAARNVITNLKISGSTNLSAGLLDGIAQIRKSTFKDRPCSILLLTDGGATDGITNAEVLAKRMHEELQRVPNSVTVHTFGLGAGHSATFLRTISDKGNGMYYFIQEAKSIQVHFAECLGGLLSTVAKDIQLSVITSPSVQFVRVVSNIKGIQMAGTRSCIIPLGELSSEEKRNVMIQVRLPVLSNACKDQPVASLKLSYLNTIASQQCDSLADITIDRTETSSNPSSSTSVSSGGAVENTKNAALDEQRNRILAAEALEAAATMATQGNMAKAKSILSETLSKLEASISHTSVFTQGLEKDLRQAISTISGAGFDHTASKYLYSLSRCHTNQRSSGITTAGAASYITSAKRDMIQATGDNRFAALSSLDPVVPPTTTKKTSSSNSTSVSTPTPTPTPTSTPAPAIPAASTRNANGSFTTGSIIFVPARNASGISGSVPLTMTRVADLSPKAAFLTLGDAKNSAARSKAILSKEIIAKALRRLMLDWQEIQHNPLSNICASPLESDFFEWHANLQGPADSPYRDVCFHMVMVFPHTYPIDPPKIFFCSYISHQHVFGSWVCLDLLEEAAFASAAEVNKPYTGWSTAYTVQSILLQLQSFLFDEAASDSDSIAKAKKSASQFSCDVCKHSHATPWPAISKIAVAKEISPAAALALPPSTPLIAISNNFPKTTSSASSSRKVLAPAAGLQVVPAAKSVVAAIAQRKNANKKSATVTTGGRVSQVGAQQHHVSAPSNPHAWTRMNSNTLQKLKTPAGIARPPPSPTPAPVVSSKPAAAAVPSPAASPSKPAAAIVSTVTPRRAPSVVLSAPQLKSASAFDLTFGSFSAKPQQSAATSKVVAEIQPAAAAAAAAASVLATPSLAFAKAVQRPPASRAGGSDVAFLADTPSPAAQTPAATQPKQASATSMAADSEYSLSKTLEQSVKALGGPSKVRGLEGSFFSFLVDELLVAIFSYLPPRHVSRLSIVCKDFKRIASDTPLWRELFKQFYPGVEFETRSLDGWKHSFASERSLAMNGRICFHTKASFRDTTLGVPISYSINPLSGRMDRITSTLDLLSREAFYEDGVRKSVWKESFTDWLPLYIHPSHGDAALSLMQRSIAKLCGQSEQNFKPEMVLQVLPPLMNTMVVNVMNGSLHASIVALEGYCAFHRLLLFFAQKYPSLQKIIDDRALSFVRDDSSRHKDKLPSLGEFLPLLAATEKVSWREICMPYLQENFDRNALWTIKKYPNLAYVSNDRNYDLNRMLQTFDATQVSMKLLMFHVYFFTHVARPEGVALADVARNYDTLYGCPSTAMKEELQRKCKAIQSTNTWDDFFRGIGMKPLDGAQLTAWLKTAMRNSEKKGYHYAPGSRRKW